MTGGDWPMTGLDWRPLAETDPVPGDPERVRELAAGYARAASFAGEQASAVRRVEQAAHGDGAARWDGLAAEAFRARVGELPRDLDQVAARHQRVAMALLDYAPALESAQRGARLALTRARDAQVRAGVSPSSPVTSLPVFLPSVQSAAERAMCTEVAQARRLLAAAVEQRDRAADQCTRALRAAGDDRLRNPHGWRRVLRAVSALAERVSTWLGVAAVLLCPVPGLGEVLAAVALTAAGVALLADLALTAYGDKSWTAIAVDAVGVLPAGRAMRLGALLPREATQARAVVQAAAHAHARPLTELRAGARHLVAVSRSARTWSELWRSPGGLLEDLARARALRRGGAALVIGSHVVDSGQAGVGVYATVAPGGSR